MKKGKHYMTVTLFRDNSGNTISTAFLMDMYPPLQGFCVENSSKQGSEKENE